MKKALSSAVWGVCLFVCPVEKKKKVARRIGGSVANTLKKCILAGARTERDSFVLSKK